MQDGSDPWRRPLKPPFENTPSSSREDHAIGRNKTVQILARKSASWGAASVQRTPEEARRQDPPSIFRSKGVHGRGTKSIGIDPATRQIRSVQSNRDREDMETRDPHQNADNGPITSSKDSNARKYFGTKSMRKTASNTPGLIRPEVQASKSVPSSITRPKSVFLTKTGIPRMAGVEPENQRTLHSRHSFPPPLTGTSHRSRSTHVRKMATHNLIPESPLPANRRHSMITAQAQEMFAIKSALAPTPFWQSADDEYQAMARSSKRSREEESFALARRIAISSSHLKDRPKTYLAPNMRLKTEGEPDDFRMDEDEDVPQVKKTNIARPLQMGVKAARKKGWPKVQPNPEPLESSEDEPPIELTDEEEENNGESSTDSGTERPETEEEDDDDDDDDEIEIITPPRPYSPPEIKFLASPPKFFQRLEPSDDLSEALEALTLSPALLKKAKRLPFLRRNLRRGFYQRCKALGIPLSTSEMVSVTVRYEYCPTPGIISDFFVTQMESWICPLCELHDTFNTREMLASHLAWDHNEIKIHWERVGTVGRAWLLQLTVSATPQDAPIVIDAAVVSEDTSIPDDSLALDVTTDSGTSKAVTPQPASDTASSSPFPHVSLSPPATDSEVQSSVEPVVQGGLLTSPIHHSKLKYQTPSMSRTPTSQSASSRERSTTATSTTTTSTGRTPRSERYPTPPPPDKPLGPSAQPPYLPAKSEYGGPDIYYSCRPGGACLLDLLNTLPMEPFGVLAWDVLDREDEIYDSDNVKDEYKVMHALWARWIVLNRNTFVANYYKGTIKFVDAYWKMIHRAAGWDALRYWLLMLLANRFLNGHDVANILKRYEGLTGMEFWYN